MIEKVSMPATAGVRHTIRDTMVDGMAYSLAYGDKVRKSVIDLLNYRYRAFVKKNPEFDGKVHVLAHSLGSVITFDILSNNELRGQLKMADKLTNCWCVGSPLASFQLLRTEGFEAVQAHHNQCMKNLEEAGISYFNMFMEHDAVAYRVEPLVKESYADFTAVRVMPWDHRILLDDPNAVGARGPANHLDPATGEPVNIILEGCTTPVSNKRTDWMIRGQQSAIANNMGHTGEMMAAVAAHGAYWTSRELMRFMIDNLSGFRTVPGREQSQKGGKGSVLSTLGIFTWSLYTFKTRLSLKKEVEANAAWRGTVASCVAPGGEVAERGQVYCVTQSLIPSKGCIWRIDPTKLVGLYAKDDSKGDAVQPQAYKTVVSEGEWGKTKAIAMIYDKIYIFGSSLHVIDLAATTFRGSKELGKGWDRVVAACGDGIQGCIYAIGPSKGGYGTIWRFNEDGKASTLISDQKWKNAKNMVLVGDDLFVFAESIWRVDKNSGLHIEVSHGWENTVAVAADSDWIYAVTKTGMMPTSGSLHRMDFDGRSEMLSDDQWGLCTSMIVFDLNEYRDRGYSI